MVVEGPWFGYDLQPRDRGTLQSVFTNSCAYRSAPESNVRPFAQHNVFPNKAANVQQND